MKLYTTKTIKKIIEIRFALFLYCGEWFSIYDENGKVTAPELEETEKQFPEQHDFIETEDDDIETFTSK